MEHSVGGVIEVNENQKNNTKCYYTCKKCHHFYKRRNGTMGCDVIDSGKTYPIVTVMDTRSHYAHACICSEYDPKDQVTVTRTARRQRIYPEVARCSNCWNLLYLRSTRCPHCGAQFEV